MYNYLECILSEVNEKGDMKGEAKTPSADNLFNVDEESEDLNAEDAEYFHSAGS